MAKKSNNRREVAPKRQAQPGLASRFRFNLGSNRQREFAALLLIGVGLLTLLALFDAAGAAGAAWSTLLRKLVGLAAFELAAGLLFAGFLWLKGRSNVFDEFPIPWGRLVAFEFLLAVTSALLHVWLAGSDEALAARLAEAGEGGGYLGWAISFLLTRAIGSFGSILLLVLFGLVGVRFAFDWTPVTMWVMRTFPANPLPRRLGPPRQLQPRPQQALALPAGVVSSGTDRSSGATPTPVGARELAASPALAPSPAPGKVEKAAAAPRGRLFGKKAEPAVELAPVMTTIDGLQVLATTTRNRPRGEGPLLPPLDLLEQMAEAKFAETDAARKARVIEETLEQFGIPVKVIEMNAGPSVTQFGVEPGFVERKGLDGTVQRRRVPVNRILSLSNDLALALAASPIRIEAPVPGRSMVGIEVPNESIAVVSLRGVMESEAFKKLRMKSPLPIALGRDVSGAVSAADLVGMPHLLIAGATGSGKSVCINAVVACLLCTKTPDQLRMIMVDPKRVELVNFNGIPHLVGPVITEVAQVVKALQWAVREMENRLQLFSRSSDKLKSSVRNIEAYNAKVDKLGGAQLPYLLIIIDELADLMLAAPEETEKMITRLAQLARATGIHLILATQRPSVDVVTGLIKANFPARISFSVTSSVDSRVVLDTPGAEKLLGRGDMLFMAPDSAKLTRLQGCFVSDDELARLVHFWREKAITDLRDLNPHVPWDELGAGSQAAEEADSDELFGEAVKLIHKTNTASTSFLQRKLGIGYPRAARLMDQLEGRGIVGPDEGNGKPRIILPVQEEPRRKR